ncbi:hypothetical protein BD413DRAFT_487746, partial [Trametes elegans]
GDAIVWWRVVTIWPGRRLIVLCGVLFPSVVNDFEDVLGDVLFPTWAGWQSGTRWWYSPYGIAASGLSLVSNALATCLIGRKLQYVQEHLNADNTGGMRSRAVEVLSLLVESGGLYFLLWVREGVLQPVGNRLKT